MCCFSGTIDEVSDTRIFARGAGQRQVLVYEMTLSAAQEVAMILPLPVPPRSPEDAVRFIDLAAYPEFFKDLDALFPRPRPTTLGMAPASLSLAVHQVGLFEASFVPTIDDFDRLDPRFRLPEQAWRDLPQYADWGFAVFKLKTKAEPLSVAPTETASKRFEHTFGFAAPTPQSSKALAPRGPQRIHPMAFEFPRRSPNQLFFPTVHIHDGKVHDRADYDHKLYFQSEQMPTSMDVPGTRAAEILARGGSVEAYLHHRIDADAESVGYRVDFQRAAGTVLPLVPLYRWKLQGSFPNQDATLSF